MSRPPAWPPARVPVLRADRDPGHAGVDGHRHRLHQRQVPAMSPRSVTDPLLREAPLIRASDTVGDATRAVLDSGLPALPVVDEQARLVGIFGEREFLGAVFPAYLKELKYAGFVKRSLEDALEKRRECRVEAVRAYTNTEHIDVGGDFS